MTTALCDLVLARDYRALSTPPDASELPALERLSSHADAGVRELAAHCLARGAGSVERLVALLDDPSVQVRYAAQRGLAARLTPALGARLLELSFAQSDLGVRRELCVLAAESGLEATAHPPSASALEHAAEREPDPVARAARWLLAARAGSERARDAVGEAHRALAPRELARLLSRPGWLEDRFCRDTLRGLLDERAPAAWIHSEARPDGPPARRVCDFAAERARSALTREGRATPPHAAVHDDATLVALAAALSPT